jgi:hypothetical protein
VNSIRLLLNSAIDYAGLFPPAGLSMAEALKNYANEKAGNFSWALGRFIVPVSRLAELDSCINEFEQNWRLSALAGDNPESDLEEIIDFNGRHATLLIDAVEAKVGDIRSIDLLLKDFGDRFQTYLEIPTDKHDDALIAAIARAGGRAKVRTGGIRRELFPSPAELSKFISSCAEHRVPFKATAGLHHALRSVHPLSYEPSSPSGTMHGFVNVLVASAFAYAGADAETLTAILEEEAIKSFDFEDEALNWRGHRIDSSSLRQMRERFFLSFGSCSFRQPISEMKALRML